MANDRCGVCGASFALVGRVHRCAGRPSLSNLPDAEIDVVPPIPAKTWMRETELPEAIGGLEKLALAKTTYRYRDPGRRRAYQRDLMRKRRANAS